MCIVTKTILKEIEYAKIAYHRSKKIKKYLDNKKIVNWKTGESYNIEYNEEWHFRQSYLYNTFRIDYLNKVSIEKGLVPIFITLTLPSEYHPSSKKYNSGLTVHDGYQKLQDIFRSVYKNFKIDKHYVRDLKFIRVIEPHKSFVPHLHALVYVKLEQVKKFLQHIGSIIKNNSLKQTEIKVLKTEKYASVYLLKYVEKTLSNDDVLGGWRIHHQINRVITMSNLNIGIDREIFSKISSFVHYDENQKDLNYFEQILSKIYIIKTTYNKDMTIAKISNYGDINKAVYIVKSDKVRFNKVDYYTEDDTIYEDEYSYKKLKLEIWNSENKLLYNSLHYQMLDRNASVDIHCRV